LDGGFTIGHGQWFGLPDDPCKIAIAAVDMVRLVVRRQLILGAVDRKARPANPVGIAADDRRRGRVALKVSLETIRTEQDIREQASAVGTRISVRIAP